MPLVKANYVKWKISLFTKYEYSFTDVTSFPVFSTVVIPSSLHRRFAGRSVSPNQQAAGWFALHAVRSLLLSFNHPKTQPHRHQSTKHPKAPGTSWHEEPRASRALSSPNKMDVTKRVTQGLWPHCPHKKTPLKNPRSGGKGVRLKLHPHHWP